MSAWFLAFVSLVVAAIALVLVRFVPARDRIAVLGGLTVWAFFATAVGAAGTRILRDSRALPPLLVLPAVALVVLLARSRVGARLASAIPAYVLIGLASYRLGVEVFLHQLSRAGVVPRMLTYEGANFDLIIGLSAPVVAWLLYTGRIGPRLAIGWSVFGMAMLLNVVVRSILTAPGPLHLLTSEVENRAVTTFPYTYIPGLLAPLAMALHVLSIRALRRRAQESHDAPPVVLITGASRGIGRSIALAYARRGARLVLAARNLDRLTSVQREAEANGAEVLISATDITDPSAAEVLMSATIARFGRIDVLVNNAGIGRVGAVSGATFEADLHATMQASLFGMIRLSQRALSLMRAQRSGAIVTMSSVMGRKAFERFGAYAIVMHAITAFSDALRQEVEGTGIHVAVIHPALTATDLLLDVAECDMPAPFRHMTPISSDVVAASVLEAVDGRRARTVLPWQAQMLLLGDAVSPRMGDAIACSFDLSVGDVVKPVGANQPPSLSSASVRIRRPT